MLRARPVLRHGQWMFECVWINSYAVGWHRGTTETLALEKLLAKKKKKKNVYGQTNVTELLNWRLMIHRTKWGYRLPPRLPQKDSKCLTVLTENYFLVCLTCSLWDWDSVITNNSLQKEPEYVVDEDWYFMSTLNLLANAHQTGGRPLPWGIP